VSPVLVVWATTAAGAQVPVRYHRRRGAHHAAVDASRPRPWLTSAPLGRRREDWAAVDWAAVDWQAELPRHDVGLRPIPERLLVDWGR